ncbi:hypothetical protein [Kushneria indalinina]|uniref:hypothetical protein n=1 Tax=Kushneria indalinina TaxID=184067 RepID=UPI0011C04EA0|nr:hypothetical protein [Kushneria indalinina]
MNSLFEIVNMLNFLAYCGTAIFVVYMLVKHFREGNNLSNLLNWNRVMHCIALAGFVSASIYLTYTAVTPNKNVAPLTSESTFTFPILFALMSYLMCDIRLLWKLLIPAPVYVAGVWIYLLGKGEPASSLGFNALGIMMGVVALIGVPMLVSGVFFLSQVKDNSRP